MQTLIDAKEVVIQLKKVREEKGLSLDKIVSLTEQCKEPGMEPVSKSSVQRVFAEGSEENAGSFSYNYILRPIANALLDFETIEDSDNTDTQAMKSLLHFKHDLIEGYIKQNEDLKEENRSIRETLEQNVNNEKLKYAEKLQNETEKFQRSLEFVKHQVELKDQRIDDLLLMNKELMTTNNKLINQLMECPYKQSSKPEK